MRWMDGWMDDWIEWVCRCVRICDGCCIGYLQPLHYRVFLVDVWSRVPSVQPSPTCPWSRHHYALHADQCCDAKYLQTHTYAQTQTSMRIHTQKWRSEAYMQSKELSRIGSASMHRRSTHGYSLAHINTTGWMCRVCHMTVWMHEWMSVVLMYQRRMLGLVEWLRGCVANRRDQSWMCPHHQSECSH